MTPEPRGAYGVALDGPLAQHPAFRFVPDARARLRLESLVSGEGDGETVVTDSYVSLPLADGSHLTVSRADEDPVHAVIAGGPARTDDDLVHPYLAPIAALLHRWRGVPALHAGAVATPTGTVVLIGERGMGKTTTVTALSQVAGMSVLSDDLVVAERGHVLPGPRSLDLRPSGAELLGLSGKVVRSGERHRRLADEDVLAAERTQVRLIVHLGWGDELLPVELDASSRLSALATQLYWPTIGRPAHDLLELTSVPQVRLDRVHGLPGLNAAVAWIRKTSESW